MAIETSVDGRVVTVTIVQFDDALSDETSAYDRYIQDEAVQKFADNWHDYGLAQKGVMKDNLCLFSGAICNQHVNINRI